MALQRGETCVGKTELVEDRNNDRDLDVLVHGKCNWLCRSARLKARGGLSIRRDR